jgi:DNA-binding Lrp family transcriptional regulator
MQSAFVLLKLKLGPIEVVLRRLSEIPHIKEVHIVLGDYDVIIFIEADTLSSLKQIVFSDINKLVNVRSLRLLTVIPTRARAIKLSR